MAIVGGEVGKWLNNIFGSGIQPSSPTPNPQPSGTSPTPGYEGPVPAGDSTPVFRATGQDVPISGPSSSSRSSQSIIGTGAGVGSGNPTAGLNYGATPDQPIANGAPSMLDVIEQQYQAEQGALNNARDTVSNQFNLSSGDLGSQNTAAQNQLTTEEANRRADIQNQAQSQGQGIAQQAAQNEAQVRQLLGDLQQRQASSLSTSGNYNSSVADASNEAFGRQANSSLSGLQNARTGAETDLRNQVTSALNGVGDFYAKAHNNLTSQYQSAMQALTANRDDKLNAVTQQQGQSAAAKSANTLQAWQDYLAQKRALDLSAYQNAQALQLWQAQKSAYLSQSSAYQSAALKSAYQPVFDLGHNLTGSFDTYNGQYAPIAGGGNAGAINPNAAYSSNNGLPTDQEIQFQVGG